MPRSTVSAAATVDEASGATLEAQPAIKPGTYTMNRKYPCVWRLSAGVWFYPTMRCVAQACLRWWWVVSQDKEKVFTLRKENFGLQQPMVGVSLHEERLRFMIYAPRVNQRYCQKFLIRYKWQITLIPASPVVTSALYTCR